MIYYDGFKAQIIFDHDDGIFVGYVLGINDSISFHGRSEDELKEKFRDSIENYRDLCKKVGKDVKKYD